MALLSSSSSTPTHHLPSLSPAKSNHKPYLVSLPLTKSRNRNRITHLSVSTSDNGAGVVAATDKVAETPLKEDVKATTLTKFHNPKWVNGSWDLKQFQSKDGTTDWDSLIDAEARRRKWLEANPESTNNDQPVMFDTSIIPWWAWIKRFHLPEAELLNGRAAMVGFFMAYFVDSLTGVGLVDQTNNFFCKTLLFVAVLGVLFIRKNEDLDNLNKLFQETTLYDKQWQATWQDDNNADSNKD